VKRQIRLSGLMILIASIALILGIHHRLTRSEPVVYVQGEVKSPGKFAVVGGMTVIDALKAAGDPISTAWALNIRLVRPSPPGSCCEQTWPVDLRAIIQGGDSTTNRQVMPGDRLVVYREEANHAVANASNSKGRPETPTSP
jgi:protein involved in polysaccharide export with SLBB domain